MNNGRPTSPAKAIRAKCVDCCCGQANEVALCPMEDCPLWEFRFGKNPYIKRTYSDEQIEKMRERAKKINSKKSATSC